MKEKREAMLDLFDRMFNQINTKNKGTGLNFFYKLDVTPGKEKKDPTTYSFNISVKEAGYPERILQTFPYHKPDSMDRFTMEYEVLVSVLTLGMESSLFHWNQLGKMLNVDKELQDAAIESK